MKGSTPKRPDIPGKKRVPQLRLRDARCIGAGDADHGAKPDITLSRSTRWVETVVRSSINRAVRLVINHNAHSTEAFEVAVLPEEQPQA